MYGIIQVFIIYQKYLYFFKISRQKGWFELKDETRSYTTRIYLVLVLLQFSTRTFI